MNHFLKIDAQNVFNKSKLKEISKRLEANSFVRQTKPIGIVFKKKETQVDLEVKQKQKNRKNGLLNLKYDSTEALQ